MALTVVKTTALSGTITNAQLAGSIDLTAKVTGTLPAGNGGTGVTTYSPGKILQVQSATFTVTNTSVTTTSFTTTEVTDQITPSATSSKVFVVMNLSTSQYENSGTGNKYQAAIYRQIGGGGFSLIYAGQTNAYGGIGAFSAGTEISSSHPHTMTFTDSPNTTSAVDYTLYLSLMTASSQGDNVTTGASNIERSVTLMEIGA